MAHRNARLTPLTRLELVREVLAGWTQGEVARRFRVSRHTVAKWLRRFREQGVAGLADRSSAPRSRPRRTPPQLERRIRAVRRSQGFGPHRIAWALGIARSTVYAVLRRSGLNRLDRMHRVSRQVVRYEHAAPGDLLHLDVKKLGRIPDGGGKRVAPGFAETRAGPQSPHSLGVEYLHIAVDDHSRYAYVEALDDERGETTARFLERALAAYRRRGVHVRRLLTDNAKNYAAARVFHDAVELAGLRLIHTRPYRPQTNGKAERFIQILQDEWAYARTYRSNAQRLRALPRWLYRYNHRRPHGGIGGAAPASRL
jgi:transposase InsO family protein